MYGSLLINSITWLEVDLNAIEYNLKAVKNKMSRSTKILAIVRVDAYGHGAVKVNQVLVENGIDMLGVAFPEEGIEFRQNSISIPILILNPVLSEQLEDVLKYSLEVTVSNTEQFVSDIEYGITS